MSSPQITRPTVYRDYILTPRADGSFDLISPSTGQWASFPTQRYAKWSATFMTNIQRRFSLHAPLTAQQIPEVTK